MSVGTSKPLRTRYPKGAVKDSVGHLMGERVQRGKTSRRRKR